MSPSELPYRVVSRAEMTPHRCAVSGFYDGPFLDTGKAAPGLDPRIYLNVQVLKDMARVVGMVPGEDLQAEREINVELEHRVRQLELENEELNTLHDSYDGLVKAGYMVRKAPGRPKKKVQ